MNFGKLIKSNFDFLKSYGYRREVFSRNGDCEVYYSKKNIAIEINYSLCINEKESNETFYAMFIIISANNKRSDLFKSSLFDVSDLDALKKDINFSKNEEEKLNKYSEFFKRQINLL